MSIFFTKKKKLNNCTKNRVKRSAGGLHIAGMLRRRGGYTENACYRWGRLHRDYILWRRGLRRAGMLWRRGLNKDCMLQDRGEGATQKLHVMGFHSFVLSSNFPQLFKPPLKNHFFHHCVFGPLTHICTLHYLTEDL